MVHRLTVLTLLAALAIVETPAHPFARPGPMRAIWLWDPAPFLTDASARAVFFQFLEREGISRVWAQVGLEALPPAGGAQAATPPPRRVSHEARWRDLLADAHRRGIRIEALDGDPSYALKAYHHITLGVVEALRAFNRAAGPQQQFDGLHLDIEPYLLIPWRFRQAREQLLREYLELIVECRRRLYEFPGMQFGVDIPFWWQSMDDRTGRPIADVLFQGVRKAASAHLIDRLDNVGIMNYRNVAEGGDGLVGHGRELLEYAEQAKQARIWMGVETSRSAPTPVWFAVGLPSAEVDRLLALPSTGIGPDNRFDGFRVRLFDDGLNTHVGLSMPAADEAAPSPARLAALVALASRLGVRSQAESPGGADLALEQALRGFRRDREWENPTPKPIVDPVTRRQYPGLVATSVMLPKLTFAGVSKTAMQKELALAEAVFSGYSRYAGIAIHHYESYLAIAGGPPSVAGRLSAPWRQACAARTYGVRCGMR